MSNEPIPGNASGAKVLASRMANKTEVILTTVFLITLTVLLLAGITWEWPTCTSTESSNTNGNNNTNAPNTNSATALNTPTPAGANTRTNTNTNTNAGTNVNASANVNTTATATPTPGATSPPNVTSDTAVVPPTGQQRPAAPTQQNADAPSIISLDPNFGSVEGKRKVIIKGDGLAPGDIIRFGGRDATVSSFGTTSITVTTPPNEQGRVDVTLVRANEVKVTLPNQYNYICPAPAGRGLFLMIIMAGALGGCIHALRSLHWYVGNEELRMPWLLTYFVLPFIGAAMAVIFGLLIFAGFIDNTTSQNTSLFMIALAGLVGMFSQQAALKLTDIANATFTKPGPGKDSKPQESQAVSAGAGVATTSARIKPESGPPKQMVVITGTGFTDVKSVTFGGAAATDAAFDKTNSTITATAPPHALGTVDVVVTNGAGKAVTLSYTYIAVAGGGGGAGGSTTAEKIDPPSGSGAVEMPVTITGTGFTDVTQVLFDTDSSTTAPAVSADKSSITATAPRHVPGVVTVTVKNKAGTVKTLKYEYK